MTAFAKRTGLTAEAEPTRYLWTDAFAVCNFVGLARETGQAKYTVIAEKLVEQVHHVLGRYRKDDPFRRGWLSGLNEEEGEKHPTKGGLRIGKSLPERKANEPFSERLEWDREGQYFHYLTKWMYALDVMARSTHNESCMRWAQELAVASKAFVYAGPLGQPRMFWKMSVDLSRPQVSSMGHHDPLDGYITLQQLEATSLTAGTENGDLCSVITPFKQMIEGRDWRTDDSLGLGGLLMDATRLLQLVQMGQSRDIPLLCDVLLCAEEGVSAWANSGQLRMPPEYRLPFRELGLAIGLQGVARMIACVEAAGNEFLPSSKSKARALLKALNTQQSLKER